MLGDIIPDSMIAEAYEDFDGLVDNALAEHAAMCPPQARPHLRRMLLAQRGSQKATLAALVREFVPDLRLRIRDIFVEKMNANVGVLCLSEVRDSVLMWGHYTDCHRGFVIGFDSDHPFFAKRRGPNDEMGFLRKVEYRAARPALTFHQTDSAEWFQTKSDDWAYEKEWRIMRVLSDAVQRIDGSPYPICLFEFDPDAVREIIVGMRAEPGFVNEVRSVARNFPHAALLVAREHRTEYRLTVDVMP